MIPDTELRRIINLYYEETEEKGVIDIHLDSDYQQEALLATIALELRELKEGIRKGF